MGFPGSASGKEPSQQCKRLKRSPKGRHGNPLQYSCLQNPMDRGAWWATVHSVATIRTWLSGWIRTTDIHTWNDPTSLGQAVKATLSAPRLHKLTCPKLSGCKKCHKTHIVELLTWKEDQEGSISLHNSRACVLEMCGILPLGKYHLCGSLDFLFLIPASILAIFRASRNHSRAVQKPQLAQATQP